MSRLVEGSFEVTLTPLSDDERYAGMRIEKQYKGALEGQAKGEMMMSGVPDQGARVYVALETVSGTLDGHQGTFILAHRGTMTPKAQELSVIVVPGSGTGELQGLSGEMQISVEDGQHQYSLRYELETR